MHSSLETKELLQPTELPRRLRSRASVGEAVAEPRNLFHPACSKSPPEPHKTEVGALRLGLRDREEVQAAYEEMLADVRTKKPEADIEGMLVQRQIKGVECLLGVSRDEQLGPILVMGLGGVFVEILADVQIRIPPIGAAEARRALESLKGAKVFPGARGASPADTTPAPTLPRACLARRRPAQQHRRIGFNPVMVLPKGQGAVVVDALVVGR